MRFRDTISQLSINFPLLPLGAASEDFLVEFFFELKFLSLYYIRYFYDKTSKWKLKEELLLGM